MFEYGDSYRRKVSKLRDEIMFHEEEIDIEELFQFLKKNQNIYICSRKDPEDIKKLKQLIDEIEDWYNNQIGKDSVYIERE